MSEENSILDMDFGELMETSGVDIDTPKNEEDEVKTPTEETPPKEEDEDLNVANILETGAEKPDEDEQEDTKDQEEVEDKDDTPGSSKSTDDLSSDPFALVYAKFLLESGSISSLDEEALKDVIDKEGEAAALQYLIQGELDTVKNDLMTSLEGYQKEYAELRELGVNPEEASGALSSLEDVEAISDEVVEKEDNEQLRRNILTALYQETTQFSEDRIKKLVDRSFELGDDVQEAKEALSGLKKARKDYVESLKQEQVKQREAQTKQQQEALKNLKEKINSFEGVVPDQKINKATKTKLEKMLTTPVKQLENGQVLNAVWAKRAENSLEFDLKLAHLIDLGAFDGKFAGLKKKVKTDAATDLERIIDQKRGYTGSGRVPRQEDKDTKDSISSMKKAFGF